MVYTIIDIETTGFSRWADDILEVGYIKTNQDCELLCSGSFYFYKPEFKVESKAQGIHRLSREFLEQYADDFNVNLAKLYSMMYQGIIIGKNNQAFDIPFIQTFLQRYADVLANPVGIMGYVDLQKYFVDDYRAYFYDNNLATPEKDVEINRLHESTGRSLISLKAAYSKKKGSLEELIGMIGYNIPDLKDKFVQMFPDCPRNGEHSALFDVYMTYLLLQYAVEHKGMRLNI